MLRLGFSLSTTIASVVDRRCSAVSAPSILSGCLYAPFRDESVDGPLDGPRWYFPTDPPVDVGHR
jgi:hypothetical protein